MRTQSNRLLLRVLSNVNLGSSIAEHDSLLWDARVETSAFLDLLQDKVDLIPGTKGSGKSALYRLFVDYLGPSLLERRKVVVAYGVEKTGDAVFSAYRRAFSKMDEDEFVNFWCIYFVSLAHEQFIKNSEYSSMLRPAASAISSFKAACRQAGIPEFKTQKSFQDVLQWALGVLQSWRPKIRVVPPDGSVAVELDLFGNVRDLPRKTERSESEELPLFVSRIREALEEVLSKADLTLWLMVDKLDELFLRRSKLETTALRALLRTLRVFDSAAIRIKVFLRDDILEQVVADGDGFVALTHVTDRKAKALRWSEEDILSMVVRRLFSSELLCVASEVDPSQLADSDYREEAFYRIFPKTVFRGDKQSPTHRWIYNRLKDGRGVVTPRDVIDLLKFAQQMQQEVFVSRPDETSNYLLSSAAIQYGYREVSKRKTETYLAAEFPHVWPVIQEFRGGKTAYTARALRSLLGTGSREIVDNLVSIGFLERERASEMYKIPFLYREGLALTQGTRRS